eukprot:1178074-Prorocentrum_minimum.AAC.2
MGVQSKSSSLLNFVCLTKSTGGKYKPPGQSKGVPGAEEAPAGETAAQKKNRKKREAAARKKAEEAMANAKI